MPAPVLETLLAPATTAVLTMEMQRGVAGDLSALPAVSQAVSEAGTAGAVADLCGLARHAGAMVVHCPLEIRPGGVGYRANARMLASWQKLRTPDGRMVCEIGTPHAELMPEIRAEASDVLVPRGSGVSPFGPSDLDTVLRNAGIRTVVATGVTLNMGVFGMAVEAVNLGYDVVIVREAVIGFPAEYATSLLDTSLALLTTVLDLADVRKVWDV
jgi:nicotinamidase-related amidase